VPAHLARPRLQTLQTILLVAPVLLFSVIAHEIAHGLAALKQGDRTALEAGRLSWNPVKHIDPFFTILLPLMMLIGSAASGLRVPVLGGAKPVPVDPRNYRHVRRGDIIVSLAGVAANFVIALACAVLIVLTGLLGHALPPLETTFGILQAMFAVGVWINAVLIAFNLLPIPPLDGSHVAKYLMPRPLAIQYVRLARYGLFVLVLLLWVGQRVLEAWLHPALVFVLWVERLVSPFVLPWAAQWLQ
jgi:Zn-dependent protease